MISHNDRPHGHGTKREKTPVHGEETSSYSAAAASPPYSKNSNTTTSKARDKDDMGLYPPPQTSRPLSSQQLSLVSSLPSNDHCVCCSALGKPAWASVTYGIVLCLDCAGMHRGLGTHLSFVRSLTMDDWTDDQYQRMVNGGNAKWKSYWEAHGVKAESELGHEVDGDREELKQRIKFKYESNIARVYREALSLNVKGCRSRNGFVVAGEAATPVTLSPSPTTTMEAPESILPEEAPPSFQDLFEGQAWPFALSTLRSRKTGFMLILWGVMGITSAYGVYWWGMHRGATVVAITSSLPSSVNSAAHGHMGTTTASASQSRSPFTYYNLFALSILALTVGIPYLKLRKFALKIARGMLVNRQDAFKSARNLLMDRIAMGRAQRLKRCDVYYPAKSKGGESKAKCGLIFYPGALVDRTAYAPIASRLSESGVLVAVANLEPDRSIANLKNYPLRAEVMHILTDSILLGQQWTVDEWAIGGHSLGGHVAICAVANELSSTIKKVVLWGVATYPNSASYPCKRTLREIGDVDVLVINGSNDEMTKSVAKFGQDKIQQFEEKMPPRSKPSFADVVASGNKRGHAHHITIEGGNHAGCAHYGPQTYPLPDGIRTITLEQQQRRTAEATADFLLGITKKG